jgi:hypothetical protein
VIGGAFGVILLLFAMFFGYSLTLGRRTFKLEKRNGKELEEVEKLKKDLQELKNALSPLSEKKNSV